VTIIETVTRKLKLFSRRKVVTMLSGNYDSLFRGRGLEIDSLREYVPGDDVKDIDWKATARIGIPHTRTYSSLRDQRIVIIADTSRSMLMPGYNNLQKRDALYGVGVVLGNFAHHNHDMFALCAAKGSAITFTRYGTSTHHLESVLRTMDAAISSPEPARAALTDVYTRMLSVTKRRSAVFVVSDAMPELATLKADLHRLGKRHQVFYVQLAPSSPFVADADEETSLHDIETDGWLLSDVAASGQLQKEWTAAFEKWYDEFVRICRSQGVSYGLVKDAAEVPTVLQTMFLQAKRYAQHR
jgi:uncharacterized protein (DUF58 family)